MKITDDNKNRYSVEAMLIGGRFYLTEQELIKLDANWACFNTGNYILPVEGLDGHYIIKTDDPLVYLLAPCYTNEGPLYEFPKWDWYVAK